MVQPKRMDERLEQDFVQVSSARVYFGHQSVGGNVVEGLKDLQQQLGHPLIRINELDLLEMPESEGALLHTRVGQNEKPLSKCDDFRQILDQKLKGRVDVAMFKFCYVDFNDTSDVTGIFETYSRTMDDLKHNHPGVIFIHVTTPVRAEAGGAGVWVRERLGRPNRSKLGNVNRNEFNRLLKERYSSEPIFDLAAAMSTYPNGDRESFSVDGNIYYSLIPAFTDDGGHLNEIGRTYAAAELVRSIAAAIRAAEHERI